MPYRSVAWQPACATNKQQQCGIVHGLAVCCTGLAEAGDKGDDACLAGNNLGGVRDTQYVKLYVLYVLPSILVRGTSLEKYAVRKLRRTLHACTLP